MGEDTAWEENELEARKMLENSYNGLRYLRWGGDGEAVQPEKGRGVGKGLKMAQNPQRQVHALLGRCGFCKTRHFNQSHALLP